MREHLISRDQDVKHVGIFDKCQVCGSSWFSTDNSSEEEHLTTCILNEK